MIGQTISHYRIGDVLGEGGMGIVYRAVDTKLDRQVALKFLPQRLSTDPAAKARFVQEAKAASGLDHPNICTIYDIGEADDGSLFIAMAFYDGQTLKHALQEGPMSSERASSIAAQIADGLRKAHSAEIVHRDIKPANIMVTSEGRVKILDFGVAKLVGGADLTKEGSTVGTTAYMSPEQARGEPVDVRADLWSLGVLLYEMLSGEKPFGGEYEQAIVYSVLNESPKVLPDTVPEELSDVVNKLLAKSSDERYATAEEALHALEPWADSRIRQAVSHATTTQVPIADKIPPLITNKMALVAGAILLVAVALWLFVPSSREDNSSVEATALRSGIAVIPFSVEGDPSLTYVGTAITRLLSAKLDDTGDLRSIDPNALLGYLENEGTTPRDPASAKAVAAHFQAAGFILGNVLRAGGPIRLSAQLYGADAQVEAEAEIIIASDSLLLGAVDDITRQLLSDRFAQSGDLSRSIGALSSTSFTALNHFLAGETAMREGRFVDAFADFRQAVAEDSTFAMAWYRLAGAAGSSGENPHDQIMPAVDAAVRHMDRLPERMQKHIVGYRYFETGEHEKAEAVFQELTRDYPDDMRAWYRLGDIAFHYNPILGKEIMGSKEYLDRAVRLDPDNLEVRSHLAALAAEEEDFDLFDSLSTIQSVQGRHVSELLRDLASDDIELQDRAIDSLAAAGPGALNDAVGRTIIYLEDFSVAEKLATVLKLSGVPRDLQAQLDVLIGYSKMAQGQVQGAREAFERADSAFGETQSIFQEVNLPLLLPQDPVVMEEAWAFLQTVDTTIWNDVREISDVPLRELKQINLAFLAGLRRDTDAMSALLDTLDSSDHRLTTSMRAQVRAMDAYLSGDYEKAISFASDGVIQANWVDYTNPTISPVGPLMIKAQAYFALGNYEETVRWLNALGDGLSNTAIHPFLMTPNIAMSYYMRGKSYDALGETEKAIHFYTRFLEMWKDADPRFQSYVRDAEEGLDRLVIERTQERGG